MTDAPPAGGAGRAPRNVAVFASGAGSNLGAMLTYFATQPAPAARIVLVVSNRAGAGALARATAAGVPAATVADPDDGAALDALLAAHGVDLVVLAGYLKLVPASVVTRYHGAIVNIHPALLPRHGGPGMYGRRVHEAALRAGDTQSGATVHFVDAAYDRGAPIARATVAVAPTDTPESLAARVLVAEHFLLPRVVDAIARGAVRLERGSLRCTPAAASLLADPPAGVRVGLDGG
ncbi:MAG TPA: phosphoribosylglycinamide formyltransferase [Gemmatimonadaceae bacterium]|nr:phosphoribosylglycinamide formyltransferase [Gemmatimonadaceae bacterium]